MTWDVPERPLGCLVQKPYQRGVPNDLRDLRSKNLTNVGSPTTSGMFGPKTLPTRGPEWPRGCSVQKPYQRGVPNDLLDVKKSALHRKSLRTLHCGACTCLCSARSTFLHRTPWSCWKKERSTYTSWSLSSSSSSGWTKEMSSYSYTSWSSSSCSWSSCWTKMSSYTQFLLTWDGIFHSSIPPHRNIV